jgi:hypothetical protein
MNGTTMVRFVGIASLSILTACVAGEEEDDVASNTESSTESVCGDYYEDNNLLTEATRLRDMSDEGGNDWLPDRAALGGVPDSPVGYDQQDWYVFQVEDTWFQTLKPAVTIIDDSLEPAANITDHIEVCAFSALAEAQIECEVGTTTYHHGLSGCCAVASSDSPSTVGGLVMNIEDVVYDDTSDVYVRVRLAFGAEGIPCAEYRLGYNAYGAN